jgi:SAM-dependent methyltransferase
MPHPPTPELAAAIHRYERGEWRAVIFRDLVLETIGRLRTRWPSITGLDIGCGRGFDNSRELQDSIAAALDRSLGVEPDLEVPPPSCFDVVSQTPFETSPIDTATVHVAYSAFVLEHVRDPGAFFAKLRDVLVPGGVFWGFTTDLRHWFPAASTVLQKSGLKDRYLAWATHDGGPDRYRTYPTWYRANSPRRIGRLACGFAEVDTVSMGRIGQLDFYVPERLRPVAHLLDRVQIGLGLPGSLLVVRLTR